MSRHNYTNPAFCQQSEFYETGPQTLNSSLPNGGSRIHRSESTRSIQRSTRKPSVLENRANLEVNRQRVETPPKLGPKPPNVFRSGLNEHPREGSGRYALVPIEDLPRQNNGRYAVIPAPEPNYVKRTTKSQDNIDRYAHLPVQDDASSEDGDRFTSLPPIPTHDEPRLKSAFSSDFGSKSFVLVDQKSNQRYAVVPTAEDEEIVDDNHEIIQMHNGRKHRYAVIPQEEEETCLSNSDINDALNQSYAALQDSPPKNPFKSSTPIKRTMSQHRPSNIYPNVTRQISQPGTPLKNPIATRKLHELLSTPKKQPTPRQDNISRSSRRYQSQIIVSSTKQEFTPQRLEYGNEKQSSFEARTTAVITPRVATSTVNDDGYDNSLNKSGKVTSFQKVANATATIGVVSFMLILGGALNSGLCLYMISNVRPFIGRSYYLDIGVVAGFAAIALGILGFKSRHCDWLPNRNYISGYILATVFSLLNCCGLLILLVMHPIPGTALHDVTTGVVLALSALILLLISLGVITSRWCRASPPDNRVDVY